jgi:DNA-binding IclR family transcriptional regulator
MNNTLENGFRVLEMVAQKSGAVSVTELAAESGLPPSHVCRLLKTLVQTGYMEQMPGTRKYRVSLRILSLARARLEHLDLRGAGHPFVARIAEELRAQAYLSAPARGRSIIVDVVWPPSVSGDTGVVIGQVHSVFHSACGKVCAAFASEAEIEALHASLSPGERRESLKVWRAEFARIRTARLAVRQEVEILAVAAPLFRAGAVFCGALGVMLPEGSVLTPEIERSVRRTAGALSFALGYPFAD